MNCTAPRSLRFATGNAQGISSKKLKFAQFLIDWRIDIALISETWLKTDKKCKIANFHIYRADRADHQGGGCSILMKRVPKILNNNRKLMPEIQYGPNRYLTDQENAEALADTFTTQFPPNRRNDTEQESVFQSTLEEINRMVPRPPLIAPRKSL
ncbi:hypothetical protein Trydic_g22599 [Trypoxylus dichotomus]